MAACRGGPAAPWRVGAQSLGLLPAPAWYLQHGLYLVWDYSCLAWIGPQPGLCALFLSLAKLKAPIQHAVLFSSLCTHQLGLSRSDWVPRSQGQCPAAIEMQSSSPVQWKEGFLPAPSSAVCILGRLLATRCCWALFGAELSLREPIAWEKATRRRDCIAGRSKHALLCVPYVLLGLC